MNLLKRISDKEFSDTNENAAKKLIKSVRVVLLDENNLVAILYIGTSNFYTIPGGRIDESETIEQALKRETQEETGCVGEIICELGIIEEESVKYNWFPTMSFCFLAKVKGQKGTLNLTQMELDEETQVQWYELQEALKLIQSQNIADNDGIGKLIQERDITILKEAIRVLNYIN